MGKKRVLKKRPPWTNAYKDNWDDAYERIMAWWEGYSVDRPVVLNAVKKETPAYTISGKWTKMPRDPMLFEKRDLDEEFYLEALSSYNMNNCFTAESVPIARTNYASTLGMLAAMSGAKIDYTPDTGTAWIGQIDDLYNRPLPEFDINCPAYSFAINMINAYHKKFGFDVVLGANPMVDPLTTLSMMRGVENLCIELIEGSELMEKWLDRMGDIFIKIVEGYRNERAKYGRREDINWTGAWAPGDMDTLESDFSAMISPELFRKYAMPDVERQAEFFDFTLWHLDGTGQFKHIDDICSVENISIIQWVDEKQRSPLLFMDVWEKIRGKGKSLLFAASVDEALELTKKLGRDGLGFVLKDVRTLKEMDDALNKLKRS